MPTLKGNNHCVETLKKFGRKEKKNYVYRYVKNEQLDTGLYLLPWMPGKHKRELFRRVNSRNGELSCFDIRTTSANVWNDEAF